LAATLEIALASSAALGLGYGFDHDHIAAISDITSVESMAPAPVGLSLIFGYQV
jgi:high-affinity nickel-transport protein